MPKVAQSNVALLVSHRQLSLDLPEPPPPRPKRGGVRAGAGRKRAHPERRPSVPHVPRPAHAPGMPVHVTLRARREVAFLRSEVVLGEVKGAFSRGQREDFRIVAFSVQRDHVHLVLESEGSERLRRGLQGLTTRLARAINRALRRRGRVWADRYHRRDLANPAEVRTALVYVLQNGRKHGVVRPGALDPASSASLFFGWTAEGDELRLAMNPPPVLRAPPISLPRTWLGGVGWLLLGGGRIHPLEAPRPHA